MSYNIFILYHYDGTFVLDVKSSMTYNDESSFLLNDNLGMSNAKIKIKIKNICHGLGGITMILTLI
jgi:hypothetical protein